MSLLSESKFLFRAVGIALSSAAAAGFVIGRVCGRVRTIDELSKTYGNDSPISKYITQYGFREPLPLSKLRQATLNHRGHEMLCSADEAQLMRLLLQLINAKKVIEIGVYTGYNTLSMAMTLPPDGKVVACDVTDKYMKEVDSQSFFKEAGVESKIDLKLQSAITTLDQLLAGGEADSFDLVFVDADKLLQDQFYEKSLLLLRKGGLIVLDNVLWEGKVCDPNKIASDEQARALHNLNVKVHKDPRVLMCLMPFADGVTLAVKI